MNPRTVNKLAKLIFAAQWGVTGLEYSTRRTSDWRSRDARRAAEYVLTKFDVSEKASALTSHKDGS